MTAPPLRRSAGRSPTPEALLEAVERQSAASLRVERREADGGIGRGRSDDRRV